MLYTHQTVLKKKHNQKKQQKKTPILFFKKFKKLPNGFHHLDYVIHTLLVNYLIIKNTKREILLN